jgi:hypothetical protein
MVARSFTFRHTRPDKVSLMTRASARPYSLLSHALLFVALVIAWSTSSAQDFDEGKTNFRLHWLKSSETDLVTAAFGDYERSPESNYAISADWGRRFSDTLFTLPIEMTFNLGVQYLDERGNQPDAWGTTAYIKAHYTWRLPFTQKHVRFGIGEGLSYVSRIPLSEQRDFAKKQAESEKLLNYVEWTIDVPLRQFDWFAPLFQGSGIKEMYFGYKVWHRSSVFGLFADEKGGVNFMGFGFEARY